jgi:CO/xanthine dehydrogenase FAD-binding subunit
LDSRFRRDIIIQNGVPFSGICDEPRKTISAAGASPGAARVKPAAFAYLAPRTLDQALQFAREYADDGKLLAGGQSLMPALNFRLATPSVLIDLNRVEGLSGISRSASGLLIGAVTRHRAVECSAEVGAGCPLLSAAMPHIAHVQIRNRGTIGGSLSHADPAAELPAVMMACGARLRIEGVDGGRLIPADDFFHGLFTTAIKPGEILTEIQLPAWPADRYWGFQEVNRRHGDFALAGAAVWVDVDAATHCTAASVVLFGVGDTPVRAAQAETCLVGHSMAAPRIREAAELAAAMCEPASDIHASAEYRREVVRVMVRRALEQAAGGNNHGIAM